MSLHDPSNRKYRIRSAARFIPRRRVKPPAWDYVLAISPRLHRLRDLDDRLRHLTPEGMTDAEFVALCACFGDNEKRQILGPLILDLMKHDIKELLVKVLNRRNT